MTITRGARTRATTTVGAAALTALLFGGLIAPASAAPIGELGLIDADKDGESSLVITKYAKTAANGVVAGDGTQQTLTGTVIEGVEFRLTPVRFGSTPARLDLTTDTGWQRASDFERDWNPATPAVLPTGFSLGTALPLEETGVDGVAAFDELDFGLYIVEEVSSPAQVTDPIAPFLVTLPFVAPAGHAVPWLYDVYAYPKNAVTGVTKSVSTSDVAFYTRPDYVVWNISADVPALASEQALTQFRLVDTIDPAKLAFAPTTAAHGVVGVSEYAVRVYAASGVSPLGGLLSSHYSLTANGDGDELTLAFSTTGLAYLKANAVGGRVELVVPTRVVSADATSRDNAVELFANDATRDADAEQAFGELTIFKYAEDADGVTIDGLAGAVFALYEDTDEDGEADSTTAVTISGQSWTTGADGSLVVTGLKPGHYVLVETTEPVGYYAADGDPISVEVKAGATTATIGTTAVSDNYLPVENYAYAVWQLPFTGGNGVLTFTLIGASLMALAIGLAFVSRRRAQRAEA